MEEVALRRVDGIAYREAAPDGGGEAPGALFLHGYPESSYVWRNVLPRIAEAGWRALAPDLPGFGDSPASLPGTWEHQVENVERFRSAVGLDRLALVVHDWGGLIGLRWACDHPEGVRALVITNTGFFPDGRWHAIARALRTPREGERLVENLRPEVFAAMLREASPEIEDETIAEFAKSAADPERRQSVLDLYRSGDFEKLEPYRGKLAALGVPTLVLWGGRDEFAPVAGAHRFKKEIPHADLVVIEDAGHFAQEDAPERYASEVARFLERVAAGA